MVKTHLPWQEMQVQSLHWEDPLEEGMATQSTILASLVGCSPWGLKELDTTEQLRHTAQHGTSTLRVSGPPTAHGITDTDRHTLISSSEVQRRGHYLGV